MALLGLTFGKQQIWKDYGVQCTVFVFILWKKEGNRYTFSLGNHLKYKKELKH